MKKNSNKKTKLKREREVDETRESLMEELNYDEKYLREYAKTKDGDELYARKRTGGEYYKRNADDTEDVYAKRRKGNGMVEYYAKSEKNVEFLADKINKDEFYIKDENGNEIYPYDEETKKEIYELDDDGNPIFANDSSGNPLYPKFIDSDTNHEIEYIPKHTDGKLCILRENDEKLKYPTNLTISRKVYPKDNFKNEFYLKDENGNHYYIDYDGVEIYATKLHQTEDGEERIPFFITDKDGNPVYAKNKDINKEIYPRKLNNAEFYKRIDLLEKAALENIENENSEYYAKDETEKEIYPKQYVSDPDVDNLNDK